MVQGIAQLVLVTLCVGLVAAFPTGPPAETATCVNLVPGSRSPHELVDENSSYIITVDEDLVLGSTNETEGFYEYTAGITYTSKSFTVNFYVNLVMCGNHIYKSYHLSFTTSTF